MLSGGQAPGGHNEIAGLFDYVQNNTKDSTLFGFKGGPAGIMKCKYVVMTKEFVYPYRNQGGLTLFAAAETKLRLLNRQTEETVLKLEWSRCHWRR